MKSNAKFGLGHVYLDASAEAKRRGDRRVSTEHILLAMLVNPHARTARALGVDLATARAALQRLDREALAAVGIDVSYEGPVFPGREKERLPLTPAAKATFAGLGGAARGERLSINVLLALLETTGPDPAAELLDALSVDRSHVRRQLQSA
jgi:ATP-dependent Clp protease ATP-binding subunit ClpA